MNLGDTICASSLAALPNIGSDGALPADIQVFPPGKDVQFTLQDYPGENFLADIDAATADRLNTDLQNRLARARAGHGSLPFADKNHEDAEKTFNPLRYFWGGDDPKTGGVRVVPEWTPFGASLVRAKAFAYFSQNFLFSKAKKKILGLINENVGGLVNRPGFATQAAYAKAASTPTNNLETMDTDTFKRIVEDAIKPLGNTLERIAKIDGQAPVAKPAQHPFLDAVYADTKDNAKPLAQALSDVAARNPALAADYRRSQTGGSQQIPASATAAAGGNAVASEQHEFFDVVMAHAKANNIPVDQALQDCVRSHPDLAEDYRASIIQRRK